MSRKPIYQPWTTKEATARHMRKLRRIVRCNGSEAAIVWAKKHKGASRLLRRVGAR